MLTQDQREALQEIANIGMGQAGESIARALNEFVHLSIPRVLILAPADLAGALARTVADSQVSAVRQAFHSQMRGEAIVIFAGSRCNDLADLMGYEDALDHAAETELLLDVSNLLVGACLGGIAAQLKAEIGFSAPSLMADSVPIQALFKAEDVPWDNALLVEVNFRLDQRSFACHLVILMPESEIRAMAAALDRFLEAL
ncbi:MAG: hypothetical protein HYZ19_03795 [Rhodocyclales bacterium]|nr:hypothetical protein [Rhodocyclales bacterium]